MYTHVHHAAASIIQCFVRERAILAIHRAAVVSTGRHHAQAEPPPIVAVHFAAARIQRSWKISRWRRRFVDFSERQIGWVGSLSWLQSHNRLYGTELATAKDVERWMEHRAHAPLDRDVDPWGCLKLQDHLSRMWYGKGYEELQEAEAQLQQASHEKVAEAGSVDAACLTQEPSAAHDRPLQQASWDAGEAQVQQQQRRQGRSTAHGGSSGSHTRSCTRSTTGLGAALRAPERAAVGLRQQSRRATPRAASAVAGTSATTSGSSAVVTAAATTSLSPRCEVVGRAKGQALAAPPPSSHSYTSPPRTHRTTPATQVASSVPIGAAMGAAQAVMAAAMRCSVAANTSFAPRSPNPPSPGSASLPIGPGSSTQRCSTAAASPHRAGSMVAPTAAGIGTSGTSRQLMGSASAALAVTGRGANQLSGPSAIVCR